MQYRIRRENEAPEAKNAETLWERDMMREVLLSAYQDRRRERMWKNIWRAVSTLILVALIAGIFQKTKPHCSWRATRRIPQSSTCTAKSATV